MAEDFCKLNGPSVTSKLPKVQKDSSNNSNLFNSPEQWGKAEKHQTTRSVFLSIIRQLQLISSIRYGPQHPPCLAVGSSRLSFIPQIYARFFWSISFTLDFIMHALFHRIILVLTLNMPMSYQPIPLHHGNYFLYWRKHISNISEILRLNDLV